MEQYNDIKLKFGNHQVEGEDFTETFTPVAKNDNKLLSCGSGCQRL